MPATPSLEGLFRKKPKWSGEKKRSFGEKVSTGPHRIKSSLGKE